MKPTPLPNLTPVKSALWLKTLATTVIVLTTVVFALTWLIDKALMLVSVPFVVVFIALNWVNCWVMKANTSVVNSMSAMIDEHIARHGHGE